jgi:hypothetical protein
MTFAEARDKNVVDSALDAINLSNAKAQRESFASASIRFSIATGLLAILLFGGGKIWALENKVSTNAAHANSTAFDFEKEKAYQRCIEHRRDFFLGNRAASTNARILLERQVVDKKLSEAAYHSQMLILDQNDLDNTFAAQNDPLLKCIEPDFVK